VIAFFDDDYVPSNDCVAGIARFFNQYPDVIGASGHLLADGINSPGISFEDAQAMVAAFDAAPRSSEIKIVPRYGLYGCNMAFRRDAIAGLKFDEALPRYAWQEDVDFARRATAHGKICGTDAFVGVHQGVKGGRTSGRHFGYSQIANPVYLIRKGTMSFPFGARLILRNLAANIVRSFAPEPWVDRKGRLTGNMIAFADLLRFKCRPSRILEI
jgi:GT2 family glycosyltransferase